MSAFPSSPAPAHTPFKFWRKRDGSDADPTAMGTFNSTSSVASSSSGHEKPSAMQQRDEMLSQFFGGRSSNTKSSTPPPYASRPDVGRDIEALPDYTTSEGEYQTLARYMFIYGFLFPPLWIMGVIMLCIPLRPAPGWAETKTAVEQALLLSRMRAAELKWGKRCALALCSLLSVIALISIVVWLALRHH